MVLADRIYAVGLWSFIAQVLNVVDGCTDLQLIQVFANQTVAVKVKPSAIYRRNASKGFVWRYFSDVTVWPLLVVLNVTLLMTDQVF